MNKAQEVLDHVSATLGNDFRKKVQLTIAEEIKAASGNRDFLWDAVGIFKRAFTDIDQACGRLEKYIEESAGE